MGRGEGRGLTPVVYATPPMSRRMSVTDRVGGAVVCCSDGDRYNRRRTSFTAVERTVVGLTALRNLAAPGWSRLWISRRSFGSGNAASSVPEPGAGPDSELAVSMGRLGSGIGVAVGAAGMAEGAASFAAASSGFPRRVMVSDGSRNQNKAGTEICWREKVRKFIQFRGDSCAHREAGSKEH